MTKEEILEAIAEIHAEALALRANGGDYREAEEALAAEHISLHAQLKAKG